MKKNNLTRSRIWLRVLIVNVALIILFVAIIEAIFGNWWGQNPLVRLNVPCHIDRIINISFKYPQVKGAGWIWERRDKYGFRGFYPDPSKIDILTIGGSTTAQTFVSEGQTWQDDLMRLWARDGKKVYVANAGIDGQTSYGHIRNFQLWFPLVPGLKPKYVLAYVGINDTCVPADIYVDNLLRETSLIVYLKQHSAIWLLVRMFRGTYFKIKETSLACPQPIEGTFQWRQPVSFSPQEERRMQGVARSYQRRLRYLVKEIRRFGSVPILVTQTLPTLKMEDGKILGFRYIDPDGVETFSEDNEYLLNMINQVTLSAGKETGAICIDLASDLRLEIDDCHDLMHTNLQGGAKIADYLYSKLKDLF